jgi:putative FmdB family regulatory protein
MPIYEYLCNTCGQEFEVIQKFSDPPLAACDCGKGARVERKLSLSAFHLQGKGWYKDRYGNGKSGVNGNGASSAGKTDAGASSAGKSDAGKESSPAKPAGESGPSTPAA